MLINLEPQTCRIRKGLASRNDRQRGRTGSLHDCPLWQAILTAAAAAAATVVAALSCDEVVWWTWLSEVPQVSAAALFSFHFPSVVMQVRQSGYALIPIGKIERVKQCCSFFVTSVCVCACASASRCSHGLRQFKAYFRKVTHRRTGPHCGKQAGFSDVTSDSCFCTSLPHL